MNAQLYPGDPKAQTTPLSPEAQKVLDAHPPYQIRVTADAVWRPLLEGWFNQAKSTGKYQDKTDLFTRTQELLDNTNPTTKPGQTILPGHAGI